MKHMVQCKSLGNLNYQQRERKKDPECGGWLRSNLVFSSTVSGLIKVLLCEKSHAMPSREQVTGLTFE